MEQDLIHLQFTPGRRYVVDPSPLTDIYIIGDVFAPSLWWAGPFLGFLSKCTYVLTQASWAARRFIFGCPLHPRGPSRPPAGPRSSSAVWGTLLKSHARPISWKARGTLAGLGFDKFVVQDCTTVCTGTV
ncbi:hypothetical protein CVT25_001155 [Psilocybe cyanescens]|uniref:Uncharacterized protein n=1 Tax=Psilocybe cyanescens TaxID=93625 RepID=A0A409XEX3_PSICY|nr:hypothetical protein CVT25_001155 [Psilocybe cyanescens]